LKGSLDNGDIEPSSNQPKKISFAIQPLLLIPHARPAYTVDICVGNTVGLVCFGSEFHLRTTVSCRNKLFSCLFHSGQKGDRPDNELVESCRIQTKTNFFCEFLLRLKLLADSR